ncbi:metalloprotease TldD [Plastoroseomonas hellenica]|uniref:Metalloprotease TldD n=1 Tax=Plastoroseomonas hellenica TaxID=2687306 RepID=A0ABS5F039_9PROT|nr:metalloprotease TldD [Plastoroseomonas hellenica]MBR0643607.1 metalloprotease TldD [Plastoroseomonas hellenica]MBR0665899.1 metalloprotease TldD [Plastoroseomonas hellenica]
MTALATTDALFFDTIDRADAERLLRRGTEGCEDGELFLEYRESEAIALDDGRIRSASYDTTRGFGLRAVAGDAAGYAHSAEISEPALARAAEAVAAVKHGHSGTLDVGPRATNARLYADANPLAGLDFAAKTALLAEIDAFARARDPRVVQVMASVTGEWQAVQILRPDGQRVADIRPLVRFNVSVVVEQDGRRETGSYGTGGRFAYDRVLGEASWKAAVEEALRQAMVNLESVPAPAGEMEVVLGNGWPGILLHEAIGHGLEGDFNRKGTSAFAGLLGQRIAAPGVTVVDDGTIPDRRGSLTVDDEGTPSARNVLIEDGILKGFLQDRQNARLMGVAPTGNGRRESHAHIPMPRMTNTVMLGGDVAPTEIIASVKRGLYAVNFGGGQVDITNGKFVFSASEAYLIEDGKIGAPVKGATLIGNGPDALTKVTMVGNDMALDPGIGTCGKQGQGVPVGVGQPTLKMAGLTVGGTAVR